MVQAVLSNHPRIATCPEPWVQLFRSSFSRQDLVRARFGWDWALGALAGCNPQKNLLSEIEKHISDVADQLYRGLSNEDTAYFLDKTPRYHLILDELYERYPHARFIILRRDLISVLSSIRKTWLSDRCFSALDAYAVDLIEGPRLLDQFINVRGSSERVCVIEYQDMVEDPSNGFGSLFEWLGLEFDEQLLDYGSNEKYWGSLGDPNCRGMSSVRKQGTRTAIKLESLFPGSEWRSFAKGYVRAVRSWGGDPEFEARWGRGRRSITFDSFLARHYCRYYEAPPTVRQSAAILLEAMAKKFRRKS
jgi:hypothetical protein